MAPGRGSWSQRVGHGRPGRPGRASDRVLHRFHPGQSRRCVRLCNAGRDLAHVEKRQLDRALADDNAAIRLDPTNAFVYISRGNVWGERKAYARAIADFYAAIRLDPKIAAAYPTAATRGATRLTFDRAIADYDPAIRLDPSTPAPTTTGPSPGDDKAAYARAIADYGQAIRLDPSFALAYINRGLAWVHDASTTGGGRRLRPGHPARSHVRPRLHQSGPSWGARSEYDSAIADFSEAIRLDPRSVHCLLRPGHCLGPRRRTIRRSPTTARPSISTRITPGLSTAGVMPTGRRETTTRPSPTTRKRSVSTRLGPFLSRPRHHVDGQKGVRPGDRRLRPGHPSRPEGHPRLQQPHLDPGDVPRREAPRRQEGRRIGDEGIRTVGMAGREPHRHSRRGVCRGRRLRRRRDVAIEGDRARR